MSTGWGPAEDPGDVSGAQAAAPEGRQGQPVLNPATPEPAETRSSTWPQGGGASTDWGDGPDAQVASSTSWGDDGQDYFTAPPARPSQATLIVACSSAVLGLLIGVALASWLGWVGLVGWSLSGIVTVVAVAAYQRTDLAAAASMWYAPSRGASRLRMLALALGAVGVVVNTGFFSYWVATR